MWQRRNRQATNPYSDVKARQRGDLLVVLVNERSDVENRDSRLMDKLGSSDVNAVGNYGLTGGLGTAAGSASLNEQSNSTRRFAGNAQFQSEREFLDRFTVVVEDVFPNGNLLLKGTRHVQIEGDRRTLVLTGIVRQVDVTSANTISSQDVAKLDIRYASTDKRGAEKRFLNQGWLGKRLNHWWPF